jgi:hypothetical protein
MIAYPGVTGTPWQIINVLSRAALAAWRGPFFERLAVPRRVVWPNMTGPTNAVAINKETVIRSR